MLRVHGLRSCHRADKTENTSQQISNTEIDFKRGFSILFHAMANRGWSNPSCTLFYSILIMEQNESGRISCTV